MYRLSWTLRDPHNPEYFIISWLDFVNGVGLRPGVLNLKLERGILSELLAVFTRSSDALTERVSPKASM
ncbi:hypothetical protein [Methanothermobacter sp. KEPCO 2]|uniref:hypothetical protein n=1 Tax=Methanothermobacter sp. KEPCO 2 TaxID=3240977 RepID=UPI0035139A6F